MNWFNSVELKLIPCMHACIDKFEVVFMANVTCMLIFMFKSMISSYFEKNELIRACIEALNRFKVMHVLFEIMFLKMGLKLRLLETPLGLNFINGALNHVILCVYKGFPENGPKRIDFGV